MRQIRSQRLPFERLTQEPGQHFFGYYDLQPWSGDGRYHLSHRVGFMDRMPTAADRAELGMIRMSDNRFIPLAETYAWNFQQGAMFQWHPLNPNEEILFNGYFGGSYKCVMQNIVTGVVRHLPRPLANVASDGRHGLSVNFSRLFDFRPGYGYSNMADPFSDNPAPEEDGIFLVDLQSGKEKLILSLAAISDLFADKFGGGPSKILINHITFNPSGDRFLFLVRNMPVPGQSSPGWLTLAATADLSGGSVHVLDNHFAASHYIWKDSKHLLIYADMQGPWKMDLALVDDQSDQVEFIDPAYFTFDGHCSYSPDKDFILYDSYPDGEGYRKLILYDVRKKKSILLADLLSERHDLLPCQDIRCDLHPRWNRDASAISFDSVHEGHRHVYWMDLKEILAEGAL
jgi:hypothetical protein